MGETIAYENSLVIVKLSGAITSANAAEFGETIAGEPGKRDGVIIDARELEYISSAGLRVLLAAKKRCGEKVFRIVNVSDEVMNVFDVTGFSEIMDISRARRQISLDKSVKIGAGACGEVFRLNEETIVKLYYPRVREDEIEREKDLAKKAFVLGVPTAISYDIVESNGRTGVVYEMINSKTLAELIRDNPDKVEEYIDIYVDVCSQLHSIQAGELELPDFKDINRLDIDNISGVTEEERQYLYQFLDLVPDRRSCVHGDLNINNVMVQNGECCLIDMGEFSVGIPAFDISRILFSMKFAAPASTEFNEFYELPQETIERILEGFLKKYYQADSLEEAGKKNPDVEWLYPLAWFRCCTSFLKGDRWPAQKRDLALSLLREKIIPFVQERSAV